MFSRRSITLTVIIMLWAATLVSAPAPADASAARSVTVKLPNFPVTVDGQQFDIPSLKYPPIVYKGITYFPLTYNVGKGMGLLTSYTKDKGLYVLASASNKRKLAMETGGRFKPGQSYKATIVNFPVTVNGVKIDNAKEPYPLLLFNDITYFPMTWRFAVEDFRWMSAWDAKSGLTIRTMQRIYFDSLIYDDADYLYAPLSFGNGGMLKIRKDLQGLPELMDQEQVNDIWDASEQRRLSRYPASVEDYKWQNGKLYYGGAELLSAAMYNEKIEEYNRHNPSSPSDDNVESRLRVVKVDDRTEIVNATLYYILDIPAPYTPHDHVTFIVRDGTAQAVPAFTQPIDGYAQTAGGAWIWSAAPGDITAANFGDRGRIMWVGADKETFNFNELTNAQHLQYLSVQGEDMLVRAYTLSGNTETTEGFFRLRADGTFEKLADFPGPPLKADGTREYPPTEGYADAEGNVYMLGPNAEMKRNGLKNIITGEQAEWWDYTLWEAVGKPDW